MKGQTIAVPIGVWEGQGLGSALLCPDCAEGRNKDKECFNMVLDPEDKDDDYRYPCAGPLNYRRGYYG